MNAERLHAIVIALNQEMTRTNMAAKMQELITNLQNVVNQPAPQHQHALSESLKSTRAILTGSPIDAFSPAWRQILSEIGGEEFFGESLKSNIDATLARNQLTPAVALTELQQLQKKLQIFKTAIDGSTSAFKSFKIGDEKLDPGECEIGVLIPRASVDNNILDFAEELHEIGFILNTLSEVATGKKNDLSIRTISSSDLLVYLQAAAPYAACVAVCVERVVALYKQLLEIRKLHQEIQKQGVPDKETTGIIKYANQLMENGIEKIAVEVIDEYYKVGDDGRKKELTNGIRISLNKIANRIDHGFNIEVRVAPTQAKKSEGEEDEKLQQQIATILAATTNMQFMKLEGQPILKLTETVEKPTKKQ